MYMIFTILFITALTMTVHAQDSLGDEPNSAGPVADAPSEAIAVEAEATSTEADDVGIDPDVQRSPAVNCTHNNQIRQVEIDYGSLDEAVPCSVLYSKETEMPGEIETLWSAENTVGYCEEKAADLVDRLEGAGWVCE